MAKPFTDRIDLDGEYDLSRKEELHALFAALDGKRSIVIGLQRVTYADSSLLHELGMLRKRFETCPITLAGASRALRRLLTTLSFDRLFEISDE